jgi:outer membrane protein assembly factor BamB
LNPGGPLKWKFPVGDIVDSSPAIAADGTVYFGSHDKKFYALDAGGKLRWSFPTGAEITASPAIADDGSIYINSTDGNLYRLKADGTEVWHYRINSGADGSPVLAENGDVAVESAYKMFIISPAGALVWSRDRANWIDETPVAVQGAVCFSDAWGEFMAVQLDGVELWFGRNLDVITSSPVVSNHGMIYFCTGRIFRALQPPARMLPAKSSWPMFRADARHTGRVKVN